MVKLNEVFSRFGIKPGSDRAIALMMVVAALVVGVFAGTYLWIVGENMHLTEDLWEMHMELNEIRKKNIELDMEIAQQGSIASLQQRSLDMGYHEAPFVDFIEGP